MDKWIESEVSISELEKLLNDGYHVEVDSPDGWVSVSSFVHKGFWDEYVLFIDSENTYQPVRCNENHLFETALGWQKAKDIVDQKLNFLTKNGWKTGTVIKMGGQIPIVDIQVEHENHRYYTNGVSSHNTGVGKSLFMCHMAAACLNQGKNVLYITMEMAEEKIAERIDANLLNVNLDDLSSLSRQDYEKKISSLKSKTDGKLIIKEYPTASASVLHFKTLLNELYLKRKFKPDIIFIDYLNICCSSRLKYGANVNTYLYIKAIAEELRGMAVETGVPIFSATQTTRSGFTNSDPGLEDTSESFGLPATADFMFALVSTEELEKLNQIQVKQLKNRYSDPNKNKRFVVGIDRGKMKLYDVENSAQNDLVDSGQSDVIDYNSKFKKKYDTLKI